MDNKTPRNVKQMGGKLSILRFDKEFRSSCTLTLDTSGPNVIAEMIKSNFSLTSIKASFPFPLNKSNKFWEVTLKILPFCYEVFLICSWFSYEIIDDLLLPTSSKLFFHEKKNELSVPQALQHKTDEESSKTSKTGKIKKKLISFFFLKTIIMDWRSIENWFKEKLYKTWMVYV